MGVCESLLKDSPCLRGRGEKGTDSTRPTLASAKENTKCQSRKT